MPSRGILYSATGERFVAEALASAKSSLRYNDLPHLICCDAVPAQAIDGVSFMPIVSSGNGFLDKIATMAKTPFDETLFLDTDTHVLADVSEVFGLLRRFDLAAAQTAGYTRGGDEGPSGAFYELNTGVIVYRKSPAVHTFFQQWHETCAGWIATPPDFRIHSVDQAAFRKALWDSALSLAVLGPEYNYRTVFPGRLVGQVKIIHGRNTNYKKVAAILNAGSGPRIIERFSPDLEW